MKGPSIRLCLFFALAIALVGCAFNYAASYPEDWPRPSTSVDRRCVLIMGAYVNRGQSGAKNYSRSTDDRLGQWPSLAGLLATGEPIVSADQKDVGTVRITGIDRTATAPTFSIGRTDGTVHGASFECREGEFIVRGVVPKSRDPERYSVIRFEYTLSLAADKSLIVQHRVNAKALRYLSRVNEIAYFRFERASVAGD